MSQTPTLGGNGEADAASGSPGTDRLATMAHETMDHVAAAANRASDEVRGAAARTVETAKHAREHAVVAADESLGKVRSYVERNPLTAVGIAVAVGALLTTLVRR